MAGNNDQLKARINQAKNEREGSQGHNWKDWFSKNNAGLKAKLGEKFDPVQLYLALVYEFGRSPKLFQCSQASVVSCIMRSAETKLFPGPMHHVSWIPRKNVAHFEPEYRGLLQLCRNAGMRRVSANVVYQADEFEYLEGTEQYLRHKKSLAPFTDRGSPICAYACSEDRDGQFTFTIMPIADIDQIASRSESKSSDYSAWNAAEDTIRDEMRKKTVIKRHTKLLEAAGEDGRRLAEAINYDNESERPELAKKPALTSEAVEGIFQGLAQPPAQEDSEDQAQQSAQQTLPPPPPQPVALNLKSADETQSVVVKRRDTDSQAHEKQSSSPPR